MLHEEVKTDREVCKDGPIGGKRTSPCTRHARKGAVGVTDGLKVGVEIHQGSALSIFLFGVVMDKVELNTWDQPAKATDSVSVCVSECRGDL